MENIGLIKVSKYFFPYIIVLILIGYREKILISFLIVFMHELVHYKTAKILGFNGFDIQIMPVGTALELIDIDEASPKEDLIISLSAPFMNLICAVFFYVLYHKYKFNILNELYQCNFTIGFINMLPAFPLDGGRALRNIINIKFIYKKANNISIYTSIIMGILLMAYYLFLFLSGTLNISIGVISIFIIASALKERERICYVIMKDIIKKKIKFLKRGYIENRGISVHCKKDLLFILSLVEKNKYNMFLVLNDDMKLVKTIYEEEIIEALKVYGNISIEEYINMKE